MSTLHIVSSHGQSKGVAFFRVLPKGFILHPNETFSLEDFFRQGRMTDEQLFSYGTAKVISYGTAEGVISYQRDNGSFRLRIRVEARSHTDLIACYDLIRKELGGETVRVQKPFDAFDFLVGAVVTAVTGAINGATGILESMCTATENANDKIGAHSEDSDDLADLKVTRQKIANIMAAVFMSSE